MIDNLPRGWALAPLESLCLFNPRHQPDTPRDLSVSFLPMPAVHVDGYILPHESRPLEAVWKGYTHFSEGDVLFAKITPCMENGKIVVARGLTNKLGCGTTEFHVLRTFGAVLPEYIQLYLRQTWYRESAECAMTGAVGQRRVPVDFLKATVVPLPPLQEQERILGRLQNLLARLAAIRDEIAKVEGLTSSPVKDPRLLARLEQATLAKAFRGELVPQDPNDEPANVLLERIRAEHSANENQNGRKRQTTKQAK